MTTTEKKKLEQQLWDIADTLCGKMNFGGPWPLLRLNVFTSTSWKTS